jgi:SNF2 family DNA or RNA helicase
MGLGKTAIALYLSEKHNLRTLFITKAKLKENVKRELKRLTGKDCVVLAGTNPGNLEMRKLIVEKDKHQYYMINYDIVGRPIRDASEAGQKQKDEVQKQIMPWVELINMSQFDLIIYDEAHYMKNLDSQRSTGGRALKAKHAIPLTATPIVNGVSDLFAVLSIVDPKRFSVFEAFKEEYATADGRGIRNPARLKRLLNQYMIRRRKEDVEKDLPPIIRHDYFHELSSAAAKKYADLEEGLYQKLRSYDSKDIKAVNNILEQMLRMKQLTADDKVETSVDLAREAYEETGKKVIIFSQFKESQIEIAKQLGWDNCRVINGDTSEKNLYLYKEEFQNSDKYPYLSLSTHVGQEGFNFTAAHTVIFNDLMWTPKDHRQAEARAYGRLNDLHGANAYYVQATDTIDEQITEILMRKLRIIETAVDGAQHAAVESASVLSDLIKYLKEKR